MNHRRVMVRTIKPLRNLVLSAAGLLCAAQAHAVELQIFNNLPEKEPGSIFMIENARSAEAPDNKIQFRVLPGETKNITSGNVISFVLTRVYPNHKLKYEVNCPKETTGTHRITLLQIHDNQLPGGCKLNRTGHWSKKTGLNWDRL